MSESIMSCRNGAVLDVTTLELLDEETFARNLYAAVDRDARVVCLTVVPWGERHRLLAVLAHDEDGRLEAMWTEVGDSYPSLTPACPQVHLFERVLYEEYGIRPEGHPWLKPVRFPTGDIGRADFFGMAGPEAHEVAVGPVHAGVIEPGHFRFQCHGETVRHLEISLGFQHRGIERALVQGPALRRIHLIETLAGDTTIGHGLAYCRIAEALGQATVSARAQAVRAVAAELERLANHIGDLGAVSGDVGFLPTQSYCGRIRGDVLNLTAEICGNRFGRGLVRPGGVAFDLEPQRAARISQGLVAIQRDVTTAVELMLDTPSVLARLEGVGILSQDQARKIGLVGVAARACGLDRDVRSHHPYGLYALAQVPVSLALTGDCHARVLVRWLEVQRSLRFVQDQLAALPAGELLRPSSPWQTHHLAVSLTEGWRGEICHVALTDSQGDLCLYRVVDPSLHNWFGLALALRDQEISDFPLCNKSFNLSYGGHDL